VSARSGLADFVERWPRRAFWAFLVLHVSFWSVVPIALLRNPGLDLIEGLTFGHHWQILYWKHPPLPWLIVDATRWAFGPRLWPILLVAELTCGLALWAVWRLAREILAPLPALVSVALLEGSRAFTYGSEALNHDIISLPFWALAAWFAWRAVRDGRRTDWALMGIAFGIGIYAKYSITLLLLACGLFLVVEPAGRRRLQSGGPWLAAGVFLIIVAPQLWALATQPVQPFAFARSHANQIATPWGGAWYVADFLVNQLLHLAPLIAMVALLAIRRPPPDPASRPHVDVLARRYIAAVALGPALLAVTVAAVAGYGLRWSWGVSFWNFAGLAAVVLVAPGLDRRGLRRLAWALPLVAVVSAASIAAREAGVDVASGVPRTQFAGDDLAREVAARWAAHTDHPLPFVVGDFWVAGNVSFHLRERPPVFIDSLQTPWIDPGMIQRAGGVVVWQMHDGPDGLPVPYAQMFPEALLEAPVRLVMTMPAQTASQSFGVAVVLPRN
jgi:hypothetical protein